jgi:GTP 3',8-cyclase
MATDSHGRRIDYLRISLTDRCNLRCVYCMPEEGVAWKPHADILTSRRSSASPASPPTRASARSASPAASRSCARRARSRAALKRLPGLESVALTTNGTLLPRYAASCATRASRVNVSLDSLDPDVYSKMTRGGKLSDALAGLDAAFEYGFAPVKLNVVVVRSLSRTCSASHA